MTLTTVTMMLSRIPQPIPSTRKSGLICPASQIIAPLSTRLPRPRVRALMGSTRRASVGYTRAFSNAISRTPIRAPGPSSPIPGRISDPM